MIESSIAQAELFARLNAYVPAVTSNLGRAGGKAFEYLQHSLTGLRRVVLAALLRLPLPDYGFLMHTLYSAHKAGDGT